MTSRHLGLENVPIASSSLPSAAFQRAGLFDASAAGERMERGPRRPQLEAASCRAEDVCARFFVRSKSVNGSIGSTLVNRPTYLSRHCVRSILLLGILIKPRRPTEKVKRC